MQFTETDFAAMRYPINLIPDGQLFEKSPVLRSIYGSTLTSILEAIEMGTDKSDTTYADMMKWEQYINREQLVRYIVYTYHRLSPFVQYADIAKRKKMVLEYVGINLKKADTIPAQKELFNSIILSHHQFTGHLSLNFLKFENNLKWTQLVRAMEAWEDALYQMQQDHDGTEKKSAVEIAKTKTELYKGAQLYKNDIDRLSAELMQEDLALANMVSSHLFIEKNKRRIVSPEDYAFMTPEERAEEFQQRGFHVPPQK